MEKKHTLKKGYTTGVHALFAFKCALEAYLCSFEKTYSKTIKMDNDDLDVTKGCEIIVTLSGKKDELLLNPLFQRPHILQYKNNILYLYAGKGVGVVTKEGLKNRPHFPAVNPKPLKAMQDVYMKVTEKYNHLKIFCSISVKDGEKISKKTANEKVGVIGGISILGTSGFVKPVSSKAYLDSIKTEVKFAKANGCEKLIFTIGNISFNYAKESYEEKCIIEIGNFVYDSFKIAQNENINDLVLIAGIGKITKVAFGFKNTHNRFGSVDFDEVQKLIGSNFKDIVTIKGLCEKLGKERDNFYTVIKNKAEKQIKEWFKKENSNISVYIS